MALTDKLSAIGTAIREKTGGSELLTLDAMPDEIRSIQTGGGGDLPEEAFVFSGDCNHRFAGGQWDWFVNDYGNRITTNDITDATYMFYLAKNIKRIPFDINLKNGSNVIMDSVFSGCNSVEYIHNITYKGSGYVSMSSMFTNCYNLFNAPYIYNAYPSNLSNFFFSCNNLREIPDDYFDTWNFSRMTSYSYSYCRQLFGSCYSLRKHPKFKSEFDNFAATSTSNILYDYMFDKCYALDEIKDLPVLQVTITSSVLSNTFTSCRRIKNLTFSMNEDGSPKTASWKNQTLNLNGIGAYPYLIETSETWSEGVRNEAINTSCICKYNSGITEDKLIYNAETYALLKDDPDAFCLNGKNDNYGYSRYNHDSAVVTINSLPDTSAYLAEKGGTNTIKFCGGEGSKTDGGAINTLTEEEIAVAAARGWTVSLA